MIKTVAWLTVIAVLTIMAVAACEEEEQPVTTDVANTGRIGEADDAAVVRFMEWEKHEHRLQNHALCRWVMDGKPGYGDSPSDGDGELVRKYGHGALWWTESYDGARDVAIQLGAANPEVVVSEWCHRRDTPSLNYTPTP